MLLSEKVYKKIDKELLKFPSDNRQSAIISSLAFAQDELGWLSELAIKEVADYIGVPAILAQEVATFYHMFDVSSKSKYRISVCTGLPCALRGANELGIYLQNKLSIKWKQKTKNGVFKIIESECMGACGDAPVLLINNKKMCVRISQDRLNSLINEIVKK